VTAVSPSSRVEAYHGKPILYGSGPFIDDYWLNFDVRNNLGLLYHVHVARDEPRRIVKLTMTPLKRGMKGLGGADELQANRPWTLKSF
jgi:hypothetical protein